MGEDGMERILKISIDLFEMKEIQEKHVLVDTTVQEKNITYPTDPKLQKRIVEKCRAIAKEEGVVLRKSYKRTLKQLMIDQLFHRVLKQTQKDSNKIYSLHEPEVKCIVKGKEAKKYEFGNKVSIAKTMKSGIIVGAKSFSDNPYDAHTLEPQLKQEERLTGRLPKTGIADRGYRGKKKILGVEIRIPGKLPAKASNYEKQKARKFFKARAGIEPVIGHVKHDHRMIRNYLSGTQGDAINTLLAATGFNMMKMLRRIKAKTTACCQNLHGTVVHYMNIKIWSRENQWVFQV